MGIFNRKKAEDETDDLPQSLEAAIKGLSIIPRDDERCVLCFAGESVNSWYASESENRKRILAGWPGLNESQLTQALRAINGLIKAAYRETALAKKRNSWKNWQPIRSSFYPETKDYE